MAYTLDYALALGQGKAGLTDLQAQLVSSSGTDVGSIISGNFYAIGNGFYHFSYSNFPDNYRGGIKFWSIATSGTILAYTSINPSDVGVTSGTVFLASGTSVQITNEVLTRDFTNYSGFVSSGMSGRCLLQAARKLINEFSTTVSSGFLTVYQEDGSGIAYQQAITQQSGAQPITSLRNR